MSCASLLDCCPLPTCAGGKQKQQPQAPQQEQAEGGDGGGDGGGGWGGGTSEALLGVARQVVPDNIVGAAAGMNVLGIISFSLMFGIALSSLGAGRVLLPVLVLVRYRAVGAPVMLCFECSAAW